MTNKKNILLSIDGGGVRGIIPVMILKEIEKLVGKPISENIDYFAGTSAGALIGAALALKDDEGKPKYDTQEILNLMDKVSKTAFKENSMGLFDSKYDRSEFDYQLEDVFKNTKLSETKFPISVTAFNLNDYSPKIWSTLKSLKNSNEDALLKDILGASMAAPYYFDPKQINDDFYIDGAVVSNISTISGYVDLIKNNTAKDSVNLDNLVVISLGTGKSINTNQNSYKHLGILDWLFTKNNILDIALESSALSNQKLSQELFGENYYRLNPIISGEVGPLDNNSEENIAHLQNIAQKYIDDNQDLIHRVANILTKNSSIPDDYKVNDIGYFDYFKNGVYSLASNLKMPVKVIAGILTIGYEGFKLSSMKFATKSTFVSGGNELFKEYYIDELKAVFTIASASYSLKSNLSEIEDGDPYSDENEFVNDNCVDSADAYYSETEHILL